MSEYLDAAAFPASRTLALSPGVPSDRLKAIRHAFDVMMKDPRLLADAKTRRMDITPGSGAEVEAAIADMFKAPKSVVAKARKMLGY